LQAGVGGVDLVAPLQGGGGSHGPLGDFKLGFCLACYTLEVVAAPVDASVGAISIPICALMLVGDSSSLLGNVASVSECDCETVEHVALLLVGQAAEKRAGPRQPRSPAKARCTEGITGIELLAGRS
jgi:hypothetical protein